MRTVHRADVLTIKYLLKKSIFVPPNIGISSGLLRVLVAWQLAYIRVNERRDRTQQYQRL